MNKTSELFAALETDQEKALERFYKDWAEIANNDDYEIVVGARNIRIMLKKRPLDHLCPIVAVYIQRHSPGDRSIGKGPSNVDYLRIAIALDLSFADASALGKAADGYAEEKYRPYRERLLKPFNANNKRRFN